MTLNIVGNNGPHSSIWTCGTTRVVNLHDGFPSGAIYIGRPGKGHDGYFGNPFLLGKNGSREEVLEKYRIYLLERVQRDSIFRARVTSLAGKTLVCFCVPRLCHGMILAEWVRNEYLKSSTKENPDNH